MDALIEAHGAASPFSRVTVEARTAGSLRRRDLTVLDRDNRICLTGEAKVPWAADGTSPFVEATVRDARQKAQQTGSEWFFTWNLGELVLWRSSTFNELGGSRGFKSYQFSNNIRRQSDLANPRVQRELRDGIERFFLDFMRLFRGEADLPQRPPDEYFIHAFDSFLINPVLDATQGLLSRDGRPGNRSAIDQWMRDDQGWALVGDRAELLGRAARFACYAVANKLVFYDALRKRFSDLPRLDVPSEVRTGEQLFGRLLAFFDQARYVTGDYETVFGNVQGDVGSRIPFYDDVVVGPWRQLIDQLDRFDLSRLDYDVIGRIFERLIDPVERHKYGQYYTRPEVVDLINAFAIRSGEEIVLDPGCGGGTFLVRAYVRKKGIAPRLDHSTLLNGIFGTDISPFAAHLSTINLATRDLVEDANYPRVKRSNFFDLRPGGEFLRLPGDGGREQVIPVPRFTAVVGNPPYVRQEEIQAEDKRRYGRLARSAGLLASGRSDLHVYFWAHALTLMAPDARLGFLASSQWLDAEYGFRLQSFLLENFRLEAIVESRDEPWFVGARVATVAAMASREPDPEARDENLVRFVQIQRPIAGLFENDGTSAGALEAAERFRSQVLACHEDTQGDGWRIRVRRQGDLRSAGVRLGERTRGQPVYGGGKWGIPLRAPDLWEELLSIGGPNWKPLGEIADVRFGVKSGKDNFFYVADWSSRALDEMAEPSSFETHYGVAREQVSSGRIKLVMTGTGEVHPIEAQYLVPIVHSLMDIDAFQIESRHCDKLALMVTEPAGEYVQRYIDWGEHQGFNSGATCAARAQSRPWYDLTGYREAPVLWSKAHQYRHVAPLNPGNGPVNCNLYTVVPLHEVEPLLVAGVLNSSPVILAKHLYGRPAGVEGNLKTEIVDVDMMLVPDWTQASARIAEKIQSAMGALSERLVMGLLSPRRLRRKSYTERGRVADLAALSDETELDQADRRALDDAVLELLGVRSQAERTRIIDSLYAHLRDYFENVRVKEEEAIDNKRRSARQSTLGVDQIAADVLAQIEQEHPFLLRSYTDLHADTSGDGMRVPASGEPRVVSDLVTCGVRFGEGRSSQIVTTQNREQAELVEAIARVGPRNRTLFVPSEPSLARELATRLEGLRASRERIVGELVEQRTSDPDLIERSRSRVLSALITGPTRPRRAATLAAA
jgi:methylase of polypeptide subunit release factors